jgi:hypothetical protein
LYLDRVAAHIIAIKVLQEMFVKHIQSLERFPIPKQTAIGIANDLISKWNQLNKTLFGSSELMVVLCILLVRLSDLPPDVHAQIMDLRYVEGSYWQIGQADLMELYEHGEMLSMVNQGDSPASRKWVKLSPAFEQAIVSRQKLQPICSMS